MKFKEFSDFADDSGSSIRFLKDVKKMSELDINSNCQNCRAIYRPCLDNELIDEKLLWVPEQAFKFAHNFKLKYNGELTDILIEDLLFEVT